MSEIFDEAVKFEGMQAVPAFLPTDTAYTSSDFIETYTGRPYYPLAPTVEGLSIIDIAHALSNQCRYSGHVKFFFSTAQHCCLLAEWVVNHGGSALDALQILLHDAPEAYLVDIPRPVKQFMPEYRKWDHAINDKVREWMGWSGIPIPSFQDEIDTRIVVDERRALMSKSGQTWNADTLKPLGVKIEKWTPEIAEKEFLIKYAAYTKEVFGTYQYINHDWGIPVTVSVATSTDTNRRKRASSTVIDVVEVDVRGGVGRVRVVGDGQVVVRDRDTGNFPTPEYEWRHGKFAVTERAK